MPGCAFSAGSRENGWGPPSTRWRFARLIPRGQSFGGGQTVSGALSDVVGSRSDVRVPARAGVTELFHLHYRRLVGLARLLVDDRETAEDVVQEAFEGLYRRWRRLRDPHTAATYLN